MQSSTRVWDKRGRQGAHARGLRQLGGGLSKTKKTDVTGINNTKKQNLIPDNSSSRFLCLKVFVLSFLALTTSFLIAIP
jgi:hypothetical protein